MVMPIYKKYTENAAIDGYKSKFAFYKDGKENAKSEQQTQLERYYPDEWLIVSTLQKYIKLRTNRSNKKIVVLAEGWAGNGRPSRGNAITARVGGENKEDEGYSNTPAFNKDIIDAVTKAKEEKNDTLVLVPYLHDWHHPGMTIQVKNEVKGEEDKGNVAIYLDPKGAAPKKKEVLDLQTQLQKLNFDVTHTTTKQQMNGVICGFILTASMIKFIEEFLEGKTISSEGFISYDNRKNLNTVYMFHMYINNWQFEDEKFSPLVDEVMLAEKDLWVAFIEEQIKQPDKIKAIVLDAIKVQDNYLEAVFLAEQESSILNQSKLKFIRDFQQKLIELIFINSVNLDINLENEIAELAQLNKEIVEVDTQDAFNIIYQKKKSFIQLENLLSDKLHEHTQRVIRPTVSKLENPRDQKLDQSVSPIQHGLSPYKIHFIEDRKNKLFSDGARNIGNRWVKLDITRKKKTILEDFIKFKDNNNELFVEGNKIILEWAKDYARRNNGENPFVILRTHRRQGWLRIFNPSQTDSIKLFNRFLEDEGISPELTKVMVAQSR